MDDKLLQRWNEIGWSVHRLFNDINGIYDIYSPISPELYKKDQNYEQIMAFMYGILENDPV